MGIASRSVAQTAWVARSSDKIRPHGRYVPFAAGNGAQERSSLRWSTIALIVEKSYSLPF